MTTRVPVANPLPDHGTYSRYSRHRCRCAPCRDAGRSYRVRIRYDHTNGRTRLVDNTQARVHTERLTARGWTHQQIAAAAGIGEVTVTDLLSKRTRKSQRSTVAAILRIELNRKPPVPRGMVDATGTRRRLRALMVLGHPVADVARRVGVGVSSLQQTADGRWSTIRASTASKVARVYRELSLVTAPPSRFSEQARNEAMAQGWYGPMAWADIDDPACEPEPSGPPAPRGVHQDDVAELAARGLDDVEIGRRLGVSPRTVLRARIAHNIPAGAAS
jgi:DNA-binding NarL/FixJ family response regulator